MRLYERYDALAGELRGRLRQVRKAIREVWTCTRSMSPTVMDNTPAMSIDGIGVTPVPGGAPAGVDPTGMAEYAAIANEISRIGLGGVRSVDWNRVAENSEVILREQSKHIRIGAYLAYALYETRGLKGLGVGLGLLADMCDELWNDLHPPLRRLRGRVLALEWLTERVLSALDRDDRELEASDCEAALAQATRLVTSLTERCAEAADATHGLVRVLRAKRESIVRDADARRRLEDAYAAQAAASTSHEPPAARANRAGTADDRAARKALERSLRELARSMLDTARDMRAADVADVRAYTLHRASIWLPVRELPPSIDGRTDIPAPSREVRGAIESAMTGADHAGALELCEAAATDSLFWLDTHRVAADALRALGHEAAARAVRAQTAALLDRLPGLDTLGFRDGAPFADAATRRWLGVAIDGAVVEEPRPVLGAGA